MLFCLLTVGLSPSAASAASTCPGQNGKVAVVMYPPGGPERDVIGLVTAKALLKPLFSPSPAEVSLFDPAFSCDGSQVAYGVNDESGCNSLEVVDVSGGSSEGVRTPNLCPSHPAFLMDGRTLFDSESRRGQRGTYVMDPDGTHLHRLFGREQLASSADGRWFVATDRRKNFRTLYLLDAKGQKVRRITSPLAAGSSQYLAPSFSPDGKWIVYEKDVYIPPPHYRHQHDLYVVRRDGTHRRRLTTDGFSSLPAFSPDGRWIAFVWAGGSERNARALSVANPSRVKVLTRVKGFADLRSPTWGTR